MDVGDLVAHLKVQKDRSVDRELDGLGARGEAAGAQAGRGFATRFLAGLGAMRGSAGTAGQAGGRHYGEGFSRSSDGIIRRSLMGSVQIARSAGTAAGKAFTSGFLPHVDKIADGLKAIGKVGAIAGLAGGAVALAAAASQASGALLALPAAGGMAAAVFATLKVGTQGVGDALSALADGDAAKASEALAKLAPNARTAVLAIDGVRKSYAGLKASVQGALFANLGPEITSLGATYLPILERGLTANAVALNAWAMAGLTAAKSPFVSGAVSTVLAQTATAMSNNANIGGDLVTMLAALAQGGMPLMTSLLNTVGSLTAQAAAFLSSAEGAAWMAQKIALAEAVLARLGAIVANVGRLLGAMFDAATPAGMALLDTLVRLTAQAATWAASMEGQQQLTALFSLLSQVLANMLPIIGLVSSTVLTLASGLAAMPAPVQSAVTGFLAFALAAGLLLPKVIALVSGLRLIGGALMSGLGAAVMAAARWGLLGTSAATAAAATNASALAVIGAWVRMAAAAMANAARMALAWIIALGPVAWLIAAVVAVIAGAVALIIIYWDELKAATLAVGQFFMALPGMVGTALAWLGSIIAAGATAAWNWLVTTVQTAVTAAINFLLALPGMVAFALGYLAGLVYMGALAAWRFLSETLPAVIAAALAWLASLPGRVVAFLVSLGTAIAAGARNAWNWLLTTTISVGSAVIAWVAALPGRIGSFIMQLPGILRNAATSAWNGFRSATISLATSALAFIMALPGRIRGFFSGAAQWLVSAGRDIIRGLWDGLKSMAQGVLDYIRDLGRRVADGFKAAVGIGSPSKIFASHGVDIGRGLVVGLDRIGPRVIGATRGLADSASGAAAAVIRARAPGPAAARGGSDSGPMLRLVAELADAVDAAREVANRPIKLDGAEVRQRLHTREARERRLVTATRS